MVVASESMKRIRSYMEMVARVDCTVLLIGESGVGKEVIARGIHMMGPRSQAPFVAVNCGAIPEGLFESELFGYTGGSFTGARKNGKLGLIAQAHGGTLFLDEIAELPLSMQPKFLRFLQSHEVVPVGGAKPDVVDVRVIAATNAPLEDLVAKKRFRQDLYYRINVVPIAVPPLRDRPEDIEPLALQFLDVYNKRFGFNKRISDRAIQVLRRWAWPGNVRELENLIQRLVVVSPNEVIEPSDLPEELCPQNSPVPDHKSLRDAIESLERGLICSLYIKYKSSYKVAQELEISQSTVVRRLQSYRREGYLVPRD